MLSASEAASTVFAPPRTKSGWPSTRVAIVPAFANLIVQMTISAHEISIVALSVLPLRVAPHHMLASWSLAPMCKSA